MAAQSCTLEYLAEAFGACQEEIITEWRLQAGALLQALNLDKLTITNHLPDIIAEITRDLALQRSGDISIEHTRGSPPAHGVQRFHDGLDVGEVVAEYNLLRGAFITVADRHGLQVVGEAARIIHHRVDEAVRLSVMSFAAQQAIIRKEQDAEHLAFIAHDLRTPLNAVSLLVDELGHTLDAKVLAETADIFVVLRRNLSRVEDLIKRVLHTNIQTRSQESSFEPVSRVFELWPLVQRLLLDLAPVSGKCGINIINEIPRPLTVFADAGLVSEVFQNLLSNSFKYTAGGQIWINAREESEAIICTVRDDGAGIPPALLNKVFEKETTDPGKGGTGLGLAIVKQIVEAHGGSVGVESDHGAGATLTFTLPLAPDSAPAAGKAMK